MRKADPSTTAGALLIALLLVLGGCSGESSNATETPEGPEQGGPEGEETPEPHGPAAAHAPAERMREVTSTPEMISAGRELFSQCAACHGDSGQGRLGIGPQLTSRSFLAAASDDFLRRTIKNGRIGTTMPAWGALSDEQVGSIIAFLRSETTVDPVELNEAPLHGDATEGGNVFHQICAGCHGRTGAGYQETSNGTGIGRRAFLTSVSDGFLRYIIKNGKSDTPMRGFAEESRTAVANLTDEQIDDVIAYLRENAW